MWDTKSHQCANTTKEVTAVMEVSVSSLTTTKSAKRESVATSTAEKDTQSM